MALRINTNIAALTAHTNMIKNDNALTASLEKLSSGLRINKAADDASGMAIADSLRSQSLGLGQAIRNANDGISMVQTADGALDEAIKIVNTIKTKAIQAAQDGQTTESRNAIQADIDKLIEELDSIAKTTAFNNQKLLSGQFTNKKFQIGAYTGETVGISIGSAESTKVGHVTTGQLTASGTGEVRLSIFSNLLNQEVKLQSVELAYDNTRDNSMAALADAINKVADITGVSAEVDVAVTSTSAVAAGTTGSDFSINGVAIGSLTVLANDSDGSLVNAINQKTAQHGVTASVDESGFLTLTSTDGRAIQVTGSTGTVLTGTNLSTLGEIKLTQTGANEIIINDDSDKVSLNLTASFALYEDMTTLTDSTLAKDSTVGSSSVFKAGSTAGFNLGVTGLAADVTTTEDSSLLAGSVLGSNSVIESLSILGGTLNLKGDVTTTADSLLKTGTILGSASVLATGTTLGQDIVVGANTYTKGTTLTGNVTLSANTRYTLNADWTLGNASVIDSNSVIAGGSYIGGDATISQTMTLDTGMTLLAGSIISGSNGVNIQAGSTIGGDFTTSGAVFTVTTDMTVKAGSVINSTSALAKGSTIGGYATLSTATITLAGDMTLAAGSQLASGTVLKAGTVITDDIWLAGGEQLKTGTILQGDAITSGTNYLDASMTLKTNSVLASNSVLGPFATSSSGATATTALADVEKFRLSDINVTSQKGAQTAIAVADSALKTLDKVRSDLGSVQNQLISTISNLSATRVNIASAESTIRDVDFAEEAATFSKMQILTQAGSFAMAQANASSQTVLALLQG